MNKKTTAALGAGLAALVLGIGGVTAANSIQHQPSGVLADGADTAAENPETGDDVVVDQHDNVVKDEGETAGLVDEDSGRSYFTITVDSVEARAACPSRVGGIELEPERSTFLVVDLEASMAGSTGQVVEGATQDDLFMPLIAEAFSVTGPAGEMERNVASQSAWGCFADDVLAPAVVNAGETVRGKVVLDTSHTSGKVVYDPENNGGWSWRF